MVTFGQASGSAGESEKSSYKVTDKTLEYLEKSGWSSSLLKKIAILEDKRFLSSESFLKELKHQKIVLTKKQREILLNQSRQDKLIIHSDIFSGDLSAGEAIFKGNVNGEIPQDDITFQAQKVKIITEGINQYNKLIAENKVKIKQGERILSADYADYDRTVQVLRLEGKVSMESKEARLFGNSAMVDRNKQIAEIKGNTNTTQDKRMKIEFDLKEVSSDTRKSGSIKSQVRAERAVIEKMKNQARFEGNVVMTREQRNLYLRAGKITLNFTEKQQLLSAQAEQSVCIEQPGRVAKAENAIFDEMKQTIRMEGSAEVHVEGKYSLRGNTINLFLDVNKGEAQGDEFSPLQFEFLLKDQKNSPSFKCR